MAGKFLAVILALGIASLLSVLRLSPNPESSSSAALAAGVAQGPGKPSAANAKLEETVQSMLRGNNQLRKANLEVDADMTMRSRYPVQ
jgi:hypothetical protein